MTDDQFKRHAKTPLTYGGKVFPITADAADFARGVAKAIECVDGGTITFIGATNADGDAVTLTDVPPGWGPKCRVRRVTALTGQWLAYYD